MKNILLILLFITSTVFAQFENLLEESNSKNFFIENKGQWPEEVKYLAKIGGMSAWITNDGIVYDFYKIKRDYNEEELLTLPKHEQDDIRRKNTSVEGQVVKSLFKNLNSKQNFIPKNEQETYFNYFIGNDKSKWASYVKLYESVEIEELYTGIDVKYYFDEGLLRYDFIAKPGADINQIAMSFEGANNYSVNNEGELEIETTLGVVKHKDIVAYQEINGRREIVKTNFVKTKNRNVKFTAENYDAQKELVIDPLIYSTFIGGKSFDTGYSIKVDNNNDVYITGSTNSDNFPSRLSLYNYKQAHDIFICKFSQGRSLLFSTHIGTNSEEYGFDAEVDDSNNVYITGVTSKPADFPTTQDNDFGGRNQSSIIVKLSSNGRKLQYSNCLGGSGRDWGYSLTLDKQRKIYITGQTSSSNFPTTNNALFTNLNGVSDIFITKLNIYENDLEFSSYFGGSNNEVANSIELDPSKNIYLTGSTQSSDFPITNNAFSTVHNGGEDVFISKINNSMNNLVYSSYIGGSNNDIAYSINIDQATNIYIVGATNSLNYPTTAGSFNEVQNGGQDFFATKFSINLDELIYSTFIGGNGNDYGYSSVVDNDGKLYIGGHSSSSYSFPLVSEGFNEHTDEQGGLAICKLDINGNNLLYSNTLPGSGRAISLDQSQNAYLTGYTTQQNFYVTNDAYDNSFNGESDVFLVKIEPSIYSLKLISPIENELVLSGSEFEINWQSEGIENIRIEYSIDDGKNWATVVESTPALNGKYNWIIPSTVSEKCKIRIRSTDNGTFSDENDNNFVIYTPYQFTSPKLNDSFNIAAENINISWNGGADGNIKIEYSLDDGSSWNIITDNYDSKIFNYQWNVPYNESANTSSLLRITDVLYPELSNISEVFTIYKFYLHSFPVNSGLSIGSIKEISWDSELIDLIHLDYSIDGGSEWIRIASNIEASSGFYSWTIPNTPTTQARIRIIDASDTSIVSEKGNYTIFKEDIYARLFADSVIVQTPSYINVMFHAVDENYRGIPKERLLLYDFQAKENNTVISPAESRLQVGGIGQIDLELKTVLLLDNSTSVQPNLQNVKNAAIELINNKLTDQEFAIYAFSENPILIQDFTNNTVDLINAINSITPQFPTTNLYGSIITGLSRWEDSISLNLIKQGFLIVLTDGDDTQASSTIQQVISARGNKKIYTVGLGNDLNPSILQQIGNAGSFVVSDINDLAQQFLQIQDELLAFSNSFYRLNYQSPKRGDNLHNLRVELVHNQNTGSDSYISANFNSANFYSILPDITINSTPDNPFGVDSVSISPNGPLIVNIETPFTFGHEGYTFTPSDPSKLSVEKVPQSDTEYKFKANGNSNEVVSLQIDDPANNYSKTIKIVYDLPVDVEEEREIPKEFSLSQNYPNPFNPSTIIDYSIPNVSSNFSLRNISLKVYDILGNEIETLVNEKQSPGNYKVSFDASNLPSGIYFYRMVSGSFTETKKLMLMK